MGGEECGTFADNFVHAVIGHGYPVYSVNAHRARLHRENTKASTDSLELLGMASVLLHRQGTLVRISDTEQLQFLARHRHGMVQESTALGNKIHALVDQLFPDFLCREKSGIPSFCDASLELMSEAFSPKQLARRQLKTLADQARLLIVLREAILRSETAIGNELARHEGALARTYLHLVRHGCIYMPEKLREGDSSEWGPQKQPLTSRTLLAFGETASKPFIKSTCLCR